MKSKSIKANLTSRPTKDLPPALAKKLTPWFPATAKPARKGVYQVATCREDKRQRWLSYWDGEGFRWYGLDVDYAFKYRDRLGCGGDTKEWRGIASDPAKASA